MISLIVAHSKNHVIGNKGDIPWHLPEDLKRFKKLTDGHAIIMGRKTFESIGRPLPNRRNIVITRSDTYSHSGIEVAQSLDEALELARDDSEIFVIGGGEIYKQALTKANKVYATILDTEIEGDTYFPRLNLDDWALTNLEKHHNDEQKISYYYANYERRDKQTKLYYIDAGRSLEQIFQMEDLETRGTCIFCEDHFKREHREPIEIETDHWIVTKNDYPYEHTELHLLYVPKQHVNTLSELSNAALQEIPELLVKIEKHYKLTSYAQFMRVGDFHYNGASVHHLHGHIVVADHKHPEFKSLRVKLGSKPEK